MKFSTTFSLLLVTLAQALPQLSLTTGGVNGLRSLSDTSQPQILTKRSEISYKVFGFFKRQLVKNMIRSLPNGNGKKPPGGGGAKPKSDQNVRDPRRGNGLVNPELLKGLEQRPPKPIHQGKIQRPGDNPASIPR